MTAEVRSINAIRAEKLEDNCLLSPIEALEDTATDLRTGRQKANKVLILLLNQDEDGTYEIRCNASNMRRSEMLALCHVAGTQFALGLIGKD